MTVGPVGWMVLTVVTAGPKAWETGVNAVLCGFGGPVVMVVTGELDVGNWPTS
jgi:hypothetical protein